MPGNRKPKKRYDPQRAMRRLQAIDNKMTKKLEKAALQCPLDDEGMLQLQACIHLSFEDIRMGDGKPEDLHNLELASMLTTVICNDGIGVDDAHIGREASIAVGHMVERFQKHGRILFSGTEMADVAAAITLHDIQLEHEDMTRERMLSCLEKSLELLRIQGEQYEAEQQGENS